jgi:hypothetical protein
MEMDWIDHLLCWLVDWWDGLGKGPPNESNRGPPEEV